MKLSLLFTFIHWFESCDLRLTIFLKSYFYLKFLLFCEISVQNFGIFCYFAVKSTKCPTKRKLHSIINYVCTEYLLDGMQLYTI